jgi:hypothetical protein
MPYGLDLAQDGRMNVHAAALDAVLDLPIHYPAGVSEDGTTPDRAIARVGFGYKDAAVGVENTWAYRVYLAWPKGGTHPEQQQAAQAAFDAVPPQHDGVPIDTYFDLTPTNQASQPELTPGRRMGIHDQGNEVENGYGTAGLIVDRGGTRYILTAGHVLSQPFVPSGDQPAPTLRDIYVPERSCSLYTRDRAATQGEAINTLHEPAAYSTHVTLDAALATIESGMASSNLIEDAGGPITKTIRDLVGLAGGNAPSEPAPQVWKVGATTGLTRGVVQEFLTVNRTSVPPSDPRHRLTRWQLHVKPTQGSTDLPAIRVAKGPQSLGASQVPKWILLAANRPLTLSEGEGTDSYHVLERSGQIFAAAGDSGSAIFDAQGRVIGLLTGGHEIALYDAREHGGDALTRLAVGFTGASYISYVWQHFNLGDNAIVSTESSAGPIVAVPGVPVAIGVPPLSQPAFERTLRRSEGGRQLLLLARRHLPELRQLIHHHRRVLVTWHRSKAAGFAAALVGVHEGTRRAVPLEIDGVRAVEAFAHLGRALKAAGSSRLQADLDHHWAWLLDLVDGVTDTTAFLSRLETHDALQCPLAAGASPHHREPGRRV